MDALKKFIEKKRSEAKFKKAGRGHRMDEPSGGGARPAGPAPVQERQHPSKSSQLAGAAALARHQQTQQQHSASSRSLAVIRAQARKQLEEEAAAAAGAAEGGATPAGPRVTELEMAPNLAVNGVYYKCAIIGGEVLPKAEIQLKIKEFLYEQLVEDGGISSCLIIHSCNPNKEKVQTCVQTLSTYVDNIMQQPAEPKFRRIRQSNRAYTERVAAVEGGAEFLAAAGFQCEQLPHGDGVEAFWVFPPDGDLERLQLLRDALLGAEPIVPELDRNVRALMPSQASRQVALPPDFFAISPEELKREQQLRAEVVENMTLLQTRAMRERAEQRELRKYRYCLVRVRFPDGITLQGTFRVLERVASIFAFLRENLVKPDTAFDLLTPTGHQLSPDDPTTLAEAKLVPSVLLTWQPRCGAAPPGGTTTAYLLPELMEMIEELG
ncbi:UBX domain-containing protein 6-like [Pollicipes pollicipes]|uniref:UBX domain-containing protein 6-like n=1 Tax=Pollicipes pollicipes TaxID=41117 RepID=UPI001884F4E2|nr:UBX domain-containing protein 6-like [Pollicipes pollicipes]XP_037076727.1 UBX domain-containing protein 6-like [Pollicipes pollicipes]XP_037076728.1 UBX domain-containing protein 6-like [Pollicipes pollicipes]XP_037076729.1 UBX domain-containing protein 6-like [Pollicipes pollicipes]XP_037076730.1 UBX domain-containing protein 6-like [Pollicipes pollicipes]